MVDRYVCMTQTMQANTSELVSKFEAKHNQDYVGELDEDVLHEAGDSCGITSSNCSAR